MFTKKPVVETKEEEGAEMRKIGDALFTYFLGPVRSSTLVGTGVKSYSDLKVAFEGIRTKKPLNEKLSALSDLIDRCSAQFVMLYDIDTFIQFDAAVKGISDQCLSELRDRIAQYQQEIATKNFPVDELKGLLRVTAGYVGKVARILVYRGIYNGPDRNLDFRLEKHTCRDYSKNVPEAFEKMMPMYRSVLDKFVALRLSPQSIKALLEMLEKEEGYCWFIDVAFEELQRPDLDRKYFNRIVLHLKAKYVVLFNEAATSPIVEEKEQTDEHRQVTVTYDVKKTSQAEQIIFQMQSHVLNKCIKSADRKKLLIDCLMDVRKITDIAELDLLKNFLTARNAQGALANDVASALNHQDGIKSVWSSQDNTGSYDQALEFIRARKQILQDRYDSTLSCQIKSLLDLGEDAVLRQFDKAVKLYETRVAARAESSAVAPVNMGP